MVAIRDSPAVPAVVTRSSPRRCRRSARRRGPGRGHRVRPRAMPAIRTPAAPAVRLAIDTGPHGPGPWSPGRAPPRGGGGPHVGRSGREARHRYRFARPRAVVTRSSPPGDAGGPHTGAIRNSPAGGGDRRGPGRGHLVRPRATPAIRTPAAPAVRLAIDTGPHGPGRGHRVRAPGRCRWSACRRGPGRGHLVRPRATLAVRTSAAPAVRLAIDTGPHGPGRWSPGRAPPGGGGGPELASGPGRGRGPEFANDPGRGHQVRPRAMPAIRTPARSRP